MGIWTWLLGKGKRTAKHTPPSSRPQSSGLAQHQRSAESRGAAKLVELCSRNDLFESSKENMRREAAALLKQEGAAGTLALAGLIRQLLAGRSKQIFEALDVAQRMQPAADLVEAVREVCSAPALAPEPASCRFTAEIVGGGQVGWTDGTRANVVSYAKKVAETLSKAPVAGPDRVTVPTPARQPEALNLPGKSTKPAGPRATLRNQFECHGQCTGGTVRLAVSPCGRWLVSAGGNSLTEIHPKLGAGGNICLFDLATGRRLGDFKAHPYFGVAGLAISPDSRVLVSGGRSNDRKVRVWSLPDGRLLHDLEGNEYDNRAVAISPDGRFLATSGGGDAEIRLWELNSGRLLRTLTGHEPAQYSRSATVYDLGITPDGRYLVSAGSDGGLRIWSMPEGDRLTRCDPTSGNPTEYLAVSPDGQFAVGVEGSSVCVWSIPEGNLLYEDNTARLIQSLAISPDARLLAAGGCSSNDIDIWRLPNGAERRETLGRHKDEVTCLAISRDGQFLASGGMDREVLLWGLGSRSRLAALEGHPGAVTCLAITPDCQTVAVGTEAGTVTLWDVETGGVPTGGSRDVRQ